jgi:hypothetical protein
MCPVRNVTYVSGRSKNTHIAVPPRQAFTRFPARRAFEIQRAISQGCTYCRWVGIHGRDTTKSPWGNETPGSGPRRVFRLFQHPGPTFLRSRPRAKSWSDGAGPSPLPCSRQSRTGSTRSRSCCKCRFHLCHSRTTRTALRSQCCRCRRRLRFVRRWPGPA